MRLRSRDDDALIEAVRHPTPIDDRREAARLLARAERHGLAGVLFDNAPLPPDLAASFGPRSVARECDHVAQLAMLHRIDEALGARSLRAVALKGALLAERLYPNPASRPTSDIDLLVDEHDLDAATEALGTIGYTLADGPRARHYREEHHHVHLLHPHATFIELHFHAYRGFGTVLRSEPLLARSVSATGFANVRVLAPEDELLYLATHAAAHRFMRLGWLYDSLLLVRTLDDRQVAAAEARARELGFGRPLAFALDLLREHFGERTPTGLGSVRRNLLGAITEEPSWPVARSATRFVYTLALCDDWRAMGSYARDAVRQRLV